jgi:Protein of unknown function (DUF2877)
LIDERGEVLSIVTPQIGDGPFNLVLGEDVSFSAYLDAKSPVSLRENQIDLGGLTIHTAEAKLWHPHPDWEALHVRRVDILNQLKSISLPDHRLSIPNSLVSNFSSALADADISSAKKIASKLAGLGIGLTPTGDDFIMGAVYAAWIIHPPEIASLLAKEATNAAAPLTTSLSAAWLRSAGKGEMGISWHDFFDALISADSARMQGSAKKILAVGETSGADALAGFLGTFTCWMDIN